MEAVPHYSTQPTAILRKTSSTIPGGGTPADFDYSDDIKTSFFTHFTKEEKRPRENYDSRAQTFSPANLPLLILYTTS
jgi:hypothetical protein